MAPKQKDIPWLGRGWPELSKQIALIGVAVLLYFGVRGQTEGAESLAILNGYRVLDLEIRLGIAPEQWLQGLIAPSQALTNLANWIYIWLHWPVIIIALLWLHHYHRLEFLTLRNAMFISGAIGLVIFVSFPVAPPRLLPGFVDTVTEFSTSYRVLQPPSLVNKYAAVPSLHVGWNFLVGLALFRATRQPLVRLFAVISPIAMVVAVVATANHYILDAVAGIIVASFGLAVAQVITFPLARWGTPLVAWRQHRVVQNHAIDSEVDQSSDTLSVVGSPRVDSSPLQETLSNSAGKEPVVNDGSIDVRPRRQPQDERQFDSVTGGSECCDAC